MIIMAYEKVKGKILKIDFFPVQGWVAGRGKPVM
jgi:hypothetical protein